MWKYEGACGGPTVQRSTFNAQLPKQGTLRARNLPLGVETLPKILLRQRWGIHIACSGAAVFEGTVCGHRRWQRRGALFYSRDFSSR